MRENQVGTVEPPRHAELGPIGLLGAAAAVLRVTFTDPATALGGNR